MTILLGFSQTVLNTQCIWSVPACSYNCASCATAMRCDVCKKGYFLNPDETNCDGQFSVIPPPAKGLRTLMYAVVGCLDGSGLL